MAVTEEVIAARRQEIEHRDLVLNATLYGARVEGNRRLIEQLVANLLDNAIDHNVAGGCVDVTTTTREGQAILSVANDGLVIPAEELDRLQQPFQRLGAERTGHGDPDARRRNPAVDTIPNRDADQRCQQPCRFCFREIALHYNVIFVIPSVNDGY